jgi:uncharacterized protein (TIGR00297 family)
MATPLELVLLIAILAVFSYFSYRKQSLDKEGIFIGNIVGIITFLIGGWATFVSILVFFVVAEFSTRVSRKALKEAHEKRTMANIFGNSGAALIGLILGSPIAFFGAVSAALADTLSSEIGMLSKAQPRLITSLKKVKPGDDGGVTVLGFGAAVLGAAIIAALYSLFTGHFLLFPAIAAAGFIGAFVDSLLGATLESRGMLNNMEVNFLASSCGAISAYALSLMTLFP